jgi:rubrerythrin
MKLNSVDEILDFAIAKEQEAWQFYTDLAAKMDHVPVKQVFESFAWEELQHRARLIDIKERKLMAPIQQRILDLGIGDHLVDIHVSPEMTYQQALMVAMKAEKAAFRMYSDLAAAADQSDLRESLLMLAQEEAKHKLRFEIEYDDQFLKEN